MESRGERVRRGELRRQTTSSVHGIDFVNRVQVRLDALVYRWWAVKRLELSRSACWSTISSTKNFSLSNSVRYPRRCSSFECLCFGFKWSLWLSASAISCQKNRRGIETNTLVFNTPYSIWLSGRLTGASIAESRFDWLPLLIRPRKQQQAAD